MVPYRSFYLLQHNGRVLIFDMDKAIVSVEETLSSAKKLIDTIVDSSPSIDAVNEFTQEN